MASITTAHNEGSARIVLATCLSVKSVKRRAQAGAIAYIYTAR